MSQADAHIDPAAQDLLIRGCLTGDQQAWTTFLRQYEQDIARQMWRFSRDRRVLEELVQDVFVEVYRSLPRYQKAGVPLLHWMRRIATRVGYRYWKRQARLSGHVPIEGFDQAAAEPESVDPAAAAQILHRLLARLPAPDRLVLTLHYFEECSTQEIAKRMGWNRAMVKMRAWRARQKLKTMIEQEKIGELLPT